MSASSWSTSVSAAVVPERTRRGRVRRALATVLSLTLLISVLVVSGDASAQTADPLSNSKVELPYATTFAGTEGGIADGANPAVGTGFSMVQPSTNGGGYLPANLRVTPSTGLLGITTTSGIQFKTATTTANGNSLHNGLGIGFDAASGTTSVTATIVNPPATSGQAEQAGLWFGPGEDDYVKIVLGAGSGTAQRINFAHESAGAVPAAAEKSISNTGDSRLTNAGLVGQTVRLNLELNPTNSTVTGTYSVGNEAARPVGSFTVSPSFFAGADFVNGDQDVAFAGIFATHRNRTAANGALTYQFGEFGIQPVDLTPPAAPSALVATPADDAVALDWADNAETDLAGYRVYRGLRAPVATTGTPYSGAAALTTSTFQDAAVDNGVEYHYAVVAVDSSGNASAASAAARAVPDTATPAAVTLPLQVSFRDSASTPPAGYLADRGHPFANVRSYGWVEPGTSASRGISANGRVRSTSSDPIADPRQAGLMHMQAPDVPNFTGIPLDADWEVLVPNGTYDVELSVGDGSPGTDVTTHRIELEGVQVVEHAVVPRTPAATGADRFKTAVATVQVTDGRLTVAATGTNTKINYLTVTAAAPAPVNQPPTVTAVDDQTGVEGDVVLVQVDADDPDGDALTYAASGLPGGLAIDAQGVIGGTIADGSAGGSPYAATVTVTDPDGASDTDSFSYAVSAPAPVNQPPTVTAVDDQTGVEGDVVLVQVDADDPDGDALTYAASGLPGGLAIDAQGVIGGTIADGSAGGSPYAVTVTVTDPDGASDSDTFSYAVSAPADITPPAAPVDLGAMPADNAVDLRWTASGSSDVVGYAIYRATGTSVPTDGAQRLNSATPTTGTSFRDATAVNGTQYAYVVTALDGAGNESSRSNVAGATPFDPCDPYSILPCDQVAVTAPFSLDFAGDAGGYDDGAGVGTGFTSVQPSSNRGAYVPSRLAVTGGALAITASPGIQFKTANGTTPATTTGNGNSLDNGLQVGVDASTGLTTVEATVVAPTAPASNSQQVGLFLGPDEDNYIKLVVAASGSDMLKVQMLRERDGASATNANITLSDELNTASNSSWDNVPIRLVIEADAATDLVRGFYSINGGPLVQVTQTVSNVTATSLSAPAVFDAVLNPEVAGASTFAGVFATKRTSTAATDPIFRVNDFSVDVELPNAAPVLADLADETVTTGVAYSRQATATDADGDQLTYSAAGLPEGVTIDSASGLISGTPTVAGTSQVTVTADDGEGGTDSEAFALVIEPAPVAPISAPAGVTATASSGQIVVAWSPNAAAENVAGYNVYLREGTSDRLVAVTGASRRSVTFGGLVNGTTYTYVVVARGTDGRLSAPSAEASATPAAPGPTAPSGVTLTPDQDLVSIEWTANAAEQGVVSYEVFRTAPTRLRLAQTADTFVVDLGARNGTTYSYSVVAIDDQGRRSPESAPVSTTPPDGTPPPAPDTTAPGAPEDVAATPGDTTATVSWSARPADEGATAYRVYRDDVLVSPQGQGLAPSFADSGLTNGTAYDYEVTAIDAAGNESARSTAVRVTPVADQGEPVEEPCSPFSVLPCSDLAVDAPYAVDFESVEDRGLTDADGQQTGFTMVQPASNTQAQGGYVPANIDLDAQSGQLRITTTNGIQYKTVADQTLATHRNNALQNALGVGVDATDDVVVRSTVVQVPPSVGSTSEQAGLWLGPDEDTYTKLVVASAGANLHRIQLLTEADGISTTANEVNVPPTNLAGKAVVLELRVDQQTGQITGFYGLDGGALQPVTETRSGAQRTSLPAPSGLLDEARTPAVPGATTFAGIFATHRIRTEGVPLTYRFADFAVTDDGTGAGGAVVVPAGPVDVRVNFQSAAAPLAAGYLRDFGQPFGPRTDTDQGSGLTYGWVRPLTDTPLDLSVGGTAPGNGRDRNILTDPADQRWDTFMHVQADDITSSTFNGTPVEGAWQLAVPNGRYRVTVGVGDPSENPRDVERHVAVAEDVVLVAGLVPTGAAGAATRRTSGTAVVEVTDQTLTLDAASGINSKFAWVEVLTTTEPAALRRPRITNLEVPIGYAEPPATAPADGAVGVATTTFFSPTFANANGGVDRTTLTNDNVRLIKVSDGSRVPATVGTSGGNDVITLSPSQQLAPNTPYRYELTTGVRDLGSGDLPAQAFLPYSATFTTGAAPDTSGGEVGFDALDLPTANGAQYTSLAMGPDGKLYASTNAGTISRFPINNDGTLGTREDFDVVKVNNGGSRLVVGLTFDPAATAANPILWVTHTDFGISNVTPQWGGKLSRLSGGSLQTYEDFVVGLPRSKKDHVTNSIEFGPDGAMYINQGSNAAAGAPDSSWGFRAEELLTAAVLRIDPARIPASSRPLNVQTARTGSSYSGPLYDPYAPGAAVTLYATGIRNAYDLIWHSNGRLYVPSNGTAAGGNTPGGPGTTEACARRTDGYTGADVPGGTNFATQREFLFDIEQGGYYGHPNPLRCEFVMNGGNPTAVEDVADTGGKPGEGSSYYRYPQGTQPDPNYRGFAHDFLFNNSPNGVIEYAGGAFGGSLRGRLIVARYSGPDDLLALTLSADGTEVIGTETVYGVDNGDSRLNDPLDVVEGPGGSLYVTEYSERTPANARLKLLRPRGAATPTPDLAVSDTRVVLNDTVATGASAPQTVTLSNPGSAALQITGLTIGGTNAARFALPGAPQLPLTLQPGQSRDLSVTFTAAAAGPVEGATLAIASNDPTAPNAVVELRGLGTLGLGGSNEPSLQWILDAHDIPVAVGDPDPTTNALPTSPLLGQEVSAPRFERVAERPVTIEPLAVFGPQDSAGTVTRVGWYPVATPGTDNGLFSVPNDSYQSVAPSTPGTLSFDPGVGEFGLSSTWPFFGGRRVYSQDALNTWESVVANRHKVRAYPFRGPDGTVEPNAYVIAFEEHVSGYDYQDVVFVLRNVAPAGAPQLPEPDIDELIFDAVKGTTAAAQTVTLTNDGTEVVTITDVALGGPNAEDFDLVAAPAAGTAIAPGQTAAVQVGFSPASTAPLGYREGALSVTTNAGSLSVGVYGLTVNGLEGGNEPPLDAVVRTLGYPIDVGGTGLIIGTNNGLIGDELLVQQFERAGAAAPTMTPVARYSPNHSLPFGFYSAPLGEPIETVVGTIPGTEFQTLLPQPNAPFDAAFSPGSGAFGIYVQGINARKSYQQDALNGDGPVDHAVRVYPLIDRDRKAVANTYLVAFEDASNGDYQDYVFVVTGVRPAGSSGGAPTGQTTTIDFLPRGNQPPAGETADFGDPFDATRGFGWVNPQTGAPVDMTANTRLRTGTVDDASLLGIVLMQGRGTSTDPGVGNWRAVVPNGTYDVTVAAGDATFTDSVHAVDVEGVRTIDDFVPTTAERFAIETVRVTVTDQALDVSAPRTRTGDVTVNPPTGGNNNTKLAYVAYTAVGNATPDTTPPTVAVDVTGPVTSSGAYRDSATVTVNAADAGGSGLSAVGLSINGGPFTAYTAPVEVTDAGSYTVRARAADGAGNLTTSAPRSFAVVRPPPSLARIAVENRDVVPYDDRLVFNRIQNPQTGTSCKSDVDCTGTTPQSHPGNYIAANEVHDEATLRITNSGTEPLNVTGLGIDKPTEFTVVGAPALPAVVAPGADLDVVVRFVYSAAGSTSTSESRNSRRTGTLTIASDDPTQRELAVELAGMWQWRSESGDEPELDEVLATYGFGSNVPGSSGTRSPNQSINTRGELTSQGDEILSPYWRRANTTQPARVTQLAAFHTQGNSASVFWTPTTSATGTTILRHAGAWGQSFYPQLSATAPGAANFTPSSAVFGLKSDPEHSDRARNNNTIDTDQGCIPLCGHHFRMFTARDRSGAVIPNTYIGTMDYAGINYDFQDNIYLFENLAPELAQLNPSAPAPLPGATSLSRSFDGPVAGTLDGSGFSATQPNCHDPNSPPGTTAYEDARAGIETQPIGLNTAQTNELARASCPLGTPRVSYQPGLLDVSGGGLAITTFGTMPGTNPTRPSAGTNGGLNNTLVNGLTQPFDASSGTWTASTRILGPLGGPDGLTSGSRQGGVMVGTDQDNFIKLAIIGRGSPATPSIELFVERDRNSTTSAGNGTIGATPALPNDGAVGFVDLHLTGDPATGRISASYSVDGAAPVQAGSVQLAPAEVGRFFDRNLDAGLIAQSQNATPTTVRFDSFAVTRGLPAGGTAPAPRDALHRLDVGTSAGTTGTFLGVPWTSDAGRFSPASAVNEGAATGDIAGVATADMPLYRTYRGNVGNVAQTARTLTYELPTRGLGSVDLRLHFADRFATAPGQRVFDIEAEGRTLRSGFDIFAAAGAQNRATVLELNDVAVGDGSLTLALDPTTNYASIAAIEVLCDAACPAVDTTAPAAPGTVTATGNSAGIALDWPNSPEADLAGYHVERASSATGPFTRLTSSLLTTSAYTDSAAPAGATSHYRVLAADTSGNTSTPSAVASAARPAGGQQPIRINAGGAATTVGGTSWLGCASATACGGFVSGGLAYTQTGATVAGLPPTISNAMAITEWTGGQTTNTPVGGTAFAYDVPVANGNYSLVLHFAELNKQGNGQRVFDVEVENVVRLASYDIHARTGYRDHIAETLPATVTDGKLTIEFIRRVENAKVMAIEIIPAAADTTAPPAPASLSATAQAGGIALDWPDVTASDLAGYRVERLGAGNQYAQLATTAAGTSSYLDTTAPAGATSTYRVLAVDQAGNASAPTAPASATRPGSTAATYTGITWTSQGVATAPFGNGEGQAEVVGGRLYTFGGFDSQKACCTPTSRAYAFDPAANSWTALAPMPRLQDGSVPGGVTHAGIATDGTNLFIASGYTANAAGTGQIFSSDEVWRYNVTANTYTRLPDLPASNAAGQLEFVNGRLHYFGGTNPARSGDVGTHWVYDLARGTTGTWTSASPLPNPRHHMGSAVLDGKIYAIGGQHGHDGGLTTQNDVHVYDPAANSWTPLTDLPSARGHIANSTVVDRGRILVMGGESSNGAAINLVNAFDPATNAWTPNTGAGSMTPLPANRVSGNAGVIGGILYFTTGGGSNVTYRGTPQGVTTPPADTTRPTVTASTPANGATGVAVATNATATFSEAMNPSTVQQAFTLAAQGSSTNVAATVSLSGNTATLNPTADLATGTTYVATVGTAAADAAGNTLSAPSTWSFTTAGSAPADGRQPIRINAGGPAVTADGLAWEADRAFSGGRPYTNTGTTSIAGTTADAIYLTERSAGTNLGSFSYAIPVAAGDWDVRLHFAEIYWGAPGGGPGGPGRRVFSTSAEGQAVVTNLDLNAVAAPATAVVRSRQVSVTDGTLNLAFSATVDQPKVSAIELVPVAGSTPPPPAQPLPTGQRFNLGGPSVMTGGVTWETCSGSCAAVGGGSDVALQGSITGLVAPTSAQLLGTARTGPAGTAGSRAFGFDFFRPNGQYTVRVHLADTLSTAAGQRVFHVDVDGARRTTGLDLFARTGGQGRATWIDYEVTLADGKLDLDLLRQVGQPIVNAVEVLDGHGLPDPAPLG